MRRVIYVKIVVISLSLPHNSPQYPTMMIPPPSHKPHHVAWEKLHLTKMRPSISHSPQPHTQMRPPPPNNKPLHPTQARLPQPIYLLHRPCRTQKTLKTAVPHSLYLKTPQTVEAMTLDSESDTESVVKQTPSSAST